MNTECTRNQRTKVCLLKKYLAKIFTEAERNIRMQNKWREPNEPALANLRGKRGRQSVGNVLGVLGCMLARFTGVTVLIRMMNNGGRREGNTGGFLAGKSNHQ